VSANLGIPFSDSDYPEDALDLFLHPGLEFLPGATPGVFPDHSMNLVVQRRMFFNEVIKGLAPHLPPEQGEQGSEHGIEDQAGVHRSNLP
jgi:hypothetical protein